MRPPHFLLKLFASSYQRKIKSITNNSWRTQERVLHEIINDFKNTTHGQSFNIEKISSTSQYVELIKTTDDLSYNKTIEEIKTKNNPGTIQKGKLDYLARTSGSTNVSKYIPYTDKLLKNFKRFSTNIMLHFCYLNGRFDILDSNILVSSADPDTEKNKVGVIIGYASGIMTLLAPKFAKKLIRPTKRILQISDLETKLSETVNESYSLDIRSFSSVPTFAIPVFEKIFSKAKEEGLEIKSILDVWPNFTMYIWSGTAIGQYENKIREFVPNEIPFREIYSATESPIAFEFDSNRKGELFLDLESCFYEFQLRGSELDSKKLTIKDVCVGEQYRILLTTYGGLFSYRLGDIIEFTELKPYLIKVIGREKDELNIVGSERIPLELIRDFLTKTLTELYLECDRFFISPEEHSNGGRGYHWCLEMNEIDEQTHSKLLDNLDKGLQVENSNYKFCRESDTRLVYPKLSIIAKGSIERYILSNKQFGQGKFLTIHNGGEDYKKFFKFIKK